MNWIRRFSYPIRRNRKELNISLIVCLAVYAIAEFVLRHTKPVFGWEDAHRVADFTVNLCLAYVASYIFFFVNDHWKGIENDFQGYTRIMNETGRVLRWVEIADEKKDIQEADALNLLYATSSLHFFPFDSYKLICATHFEDPLITKHMSSITKLDLDRFREKKHGKLFIERQQYEVLLKVMHALMELIRAETEKKHFK